MIHFIQMRLKIYVSDESLTVTELQTTMQNFKG
jgi:hypothetical protein